MPLRTRVDAMLAIRERLDRHIINPDAAIPPFRRVPQSIDLSHGLRLESPGEADDDPSITVEIDPFTRRIAVAWIECHSENGPITRPLDHGRTGDVPLLDALDRKFEAEGELVRAELDDWIAAERAGMEPRQYFEADLYAVGADAGMSREDVDLRLYENDFAVPGDLADRLVELGYTNFRGDDEAEAEPVPEKSSSHQAFDPIMAMLVAEAARSASSQRGGPPPIQHRGHDDTFQP